MICELREEISEVIGLVFPLCCRVARNWSVKELASKLFSSSHVGIHD